METILKYAGIVALVAVVLVVVMGGSDSGSGSFGGAACNGGNCTDYDAVNTTAGYYLDDAVFISGSGNITQPTSNSATSTAAVGCIQTTATSTATPIRLVISNSGATSTFAAGAASGVVAWQFGNCPI